MVPPKNLRDVSVIKDGDRWTAIVGDRRYGRFRSEEAARRFIDAFCYGEHATPTLADAIVELERARAYGEHSVKYVANDHVREIMKQATALTEQYCLAEIMRAAEGYSRGFAALPHTLAVMPDIQ